MEVVREVLASEAMVMMAEGASEMCVKVEAAVVAMTVNCTARKRSHVDDNQTKHL